MWRDYPPAPAMELQRSCIECDGVDFSRIESAVCVEFAQRIA